MAGIPTFIVKQARFNNTANLNNKNNATVWVFNLCVLILRLAYGKALRNIVSVVA